MPPGMRLALSVVIGFFMATATIGIVVTGMDALVSLGSELVQPVPTGTYVGGLSVLWVIATAALMVLLHRFTGSATAAQDGIES